MKTPFANIVTSLFVTIVLVAAARLLYYVPQVRKGMGWWRLLVGWWLIAA